MKTTATERRATAFRTRMGTVLMASGCVPLALDPNLYNVPQYNLRTVDGAVRVTVYKDWVPMRFVDAPSCAKARLQLGHSCKVNFHPARPPKAKAAYATWLDDTATGLRAHIDLVRGDLHRDRVI